MAAGVVGTAGAGAGVRLLRAVAVGAVVVGLAGVSAVASADDRDAPGTNDLDLQVNRLEHAEQADVVGAEASSMLFVPEDAAAIAAAEDARRRARGAETDAFFLTSVAPYQGQGSTDGLFDAGTYQGVPTVRDAPDQDVAEQGSTVWALIGFGALLVVGGGASFILRRTGNEVPWTVTST